MAAKRPHAAATTRTVVGGLSASAAFALVATMAATAPHWSQPAAVDVTALAAAPSAPASPVTAPPTTLGSVPPQQVVVVKRRYIYLPAGAATPPVAAATPTPAPRPTQSPPPTAAPRPQPAPQPSARTSGS